MKILIILHKVKKKGGAVLQILKMVRAFKEDGHEVSVFSFDSISRTKNIFYNTFNTVRSLHKRIETFNPTIIFTAEPIFTTLYTLLARRKKSKLVVRIGAVYDSFYAARLIEKISPEKIYTSLFNFLKQTLRFISKVLFTKIDFVVFNSHFLKNNYNSIAPHSIVIHNGVEKPSSIKFQVDKPIKLVYVGRIEPRKSIELIIKSLDILKSVENDFTFSLIGNVNLYPNYWKKILKMISHYKLTDQVKIIGEVENQKLPDVLQKHDILLFSTDDRNFPITEGLPNVILEGMSSGLAIVATPVAGIPEMINETNGFLVSANPVEFAKRIQYLTQNPDIIMSMKKQNVKDIERRFLIQKTAKNYLTVFQVITRNLNDR